MAKRKSSTLKAKTTRRAAKPADGDKRLAEALHDVFRKRAEMGNPLHDVRGAANAAEMIGDEATDSFIQAALHAVSHHAQAQIDAVRALVDEAMEVIKGTQPFRTAHLETMARIAAGACHTANPKLVKMIQDWRRLDAQGAALGEAKQQKKSDAVTTKATDLLHAIGDMEATSANDIMLKLDLACEAYGAATQDRAKFIEAGDPPLDFLFQSLLDAQRILKDGPATTPTQIALLDAANVVSSLEDGIGSLVVIGNAMHEDEKTAEVRALSFTTCKLMEDMSAIDRAINVARGLPADAKQ